MTQISILNVKISQDEPRAQLEFYVVFSPEYHRDVGTLEPLISECKVGRNLVHDGQWNIHCLGNFLFWGNTAALFRPPAHLPENCPLGRISFTLVSRATSL
jgi:hypothetical protein